jgi:hypothetical protein
MKQEKLNQYPNQNIRFEPRFASLSMEVVKQADQCPKNQVQCADPEPTPRKKKKNKRPLHIRHEKHREMSHELRK